MRELHKLEISRVIEAPLDAVFDAVCDIEARAREMPAFRRVEIEERSADGFVATMHEQYGGREVVVKSRFRFERPHWLTYEHVESPYGENRGRFTIEPIGDGTTHVHHVHETSRDISGETALREEWLRLMVDQLDAIRRDAIGRSKE